MTQACSVVLFCIRDACRRKLEHCTHRQPEHVSAREEEPADGVPMRPAHGAQPHAQHQPEVEDDGDHVPGAEAAIVSGLRRVHRAAQLVRAEQLPAPK